MNFKSLLPIAGGAAGFALGGPAGAAIGSGLGGWAAGEMGAYDRGNNPYASVDPSMGLNAQLQKQQAGQIARLQQSASGLGPSIANIQTQASRDAGLANLQAQAISDRRNPALAQRTAMIQGGMLNARLGREAMLGRLAEKQQAEQALAAAINNARAQDLQRAMAYEQARTARYQGAMGQPTGAERGANALASTLPYVMQMGQGGTPGAAPAQVGSSAHSAGMAYGLSEQGSFQHPNATPQGTWVPTGPYGQGYYR